MSNKISVRLDEESTRIVENEKYLHGGNVSRTICYIIKQYDRQRGESIRTPAGSAAVIADNVKLIYKAHPDMEKYCKNIIEEVKECLI